ncbi:DUF418 domain-containing protein [Bacillus sp. V5-8f]|uniref:DUF418 domain-containing protein n=1 Tax=Bacillus sp. V5-8f TaxID=2053044 RepID=UPI00215558A7|nr:DUF418 domain-containing protein [Bacillus sp. V5-8f]
MQQPNRMISIDILRGFSILGILLVNMPSFHSPVLYMNPLAWWEDNPDHFLYIITDIFAQASFYPLFAFLFGFGAILFARKTNRNGESFANLFSRRLLALLLFGCLHAFFIWHGDILINYALFGFAFLLFYKMSGKSLLIIGSSIYLVPFLFVAVLMWKAGLSEMSVPSHQEGIRQSLEAYATGSFKEIMQQRFQDWYLVNNAASSIYLFLSIFPLFLIGAGFAKTDLLQRPIHYKKTWAILLVVSFIVGFSIKLFPYYSFASPLALFIQDQFGGPILSFFYVSSITLLVEKSFFYNLLKPFSYVGKLSMSNYLFQSIVGTSLFYSYGLGYYGNISFTAGMLLAVGIFIIQMAASRVWLQYFSNGPVEHMWRRFIYWEKPGSRRNQSKRGHS